MAITVTVAPDDYSAAYSAMPLKFISDNLENSENFKYIINIRSNLNV